MKLTLPIIADYFFSPENGLQKLEKILKLLKI